MIFLDDGGVMNDLGVRRSQWTRMVAEFFAPKLGGTFEAWSAANSEVISRILSAESWQARLRASKDYVSFDRQYWIDWLRWTCDLVGVLAPPDADCVALGHAASRYITPRVRAALPGVVAAIRMLRQQGFVLHTASGESSEDLDSYLRGMEVRECFDRLYGPDLLDTFKDGPLFYERMFAAASVAPQNALVVDDNAIAAAWAAQAGSKTVLITAAQSSSTSATLSLGGLAELPRLIESLS